MGEASLVHYPMELGGSERAILEKMAWRERSSGRVGAFAENAEGRGGLETGWAKRSRA